MGDEHQRQFFRKRLKELDDADAGRKIERTDRFVGEHDLRTGDDRTGNSDALALAAREFVRIAAHRVKRQAYRFERFGDRLRAIARDPQRPERLADDVDHPLARVEGRIGILEDRLHRASITLHEGTVASIDALLAEANDTAGRANEPEHQPQKGRLAGAGFADEADAHATADRERDVVERGLLAGIAEADVLKIEHHHPVAPSASSNRRAASTRVLV
ncbi:hypothetical protein D9M68_282090 [compost metagenome]